MKTFNTGETEKDLRELYNPDGSDLRKGQLIMLEMLKYIDSVCRKYNIQYRLDSGNVLGAVRHGGFIPWDDDVDIALLRKDYYKLVEALKSEKHERFVVQSPETDKNFFLYFIKLRDSKSHMVSDSNDRDKLLYDGFQIDIFRMLENPIPILTRIDIVATNRIEEPLRRRSKLLWLLFHNFMHFIIHPIFRLCCLLFGDKSRIGYDFGTHAMESVSKINSYPCQPICYEGVELMGPNNPIEYCKEMYGDSFMELPPKEKRNHHSVSQYVFCD